MPVVTVNGSPVAYTDIGSGPAAILLHSSGGSRGQWRSLAEVLHGYRRILAPDLRGYGDSGGRDQEPNLADEAAIVGVLAERAGGEVDLVGHSFGGAVALRFAVERPELVRSLTLIEPVAFHLLRTDRESREWLLAEVQAIARAVACYRDGEGMRRFVDYWNGSGTWASLPEDRQSGLTRLAATVVGDFSATMAEAIPLETYRQIQVPALLLRGSESPAPTVRIVGLLGSTLPNARICTVAGAGHMLPLSHRDFVNREIMAHIRGATATVELQAA
ncbi:MAG TPA: alpha/beta hydrolase [Alphaproteobacteria bacterium]|nr:alpha/beta hydrolase [Alphaproteobacteria bacterium]